MTAGTAVKPEVPRPSSRPPSAAPAQAGFAARVDGASLADLIQMECMRGLRRVIRVTSEGRVGHLFFDKGQIVHAVAAGRAGESAAIWMLGWKNGTFDACKHPWPLRLTIQSSWQSLILHAAHQEDEAVRDSRPDAFDSSAPSSRLSAVSEADRRWAEVEPANEIPAVRELEVVELDAVELEERTKPVEEAVVGGEKETKESEVLRAVRLDEEGNVLSQVGEVVGDFADVSSYAMRLCALIGETLGLEQLLGLECTSEDKSFLAFWDEETVVALEARAGADIDQYKRRAGL